ncbi:aminotransferase class V-fold PLP-dependent enzyme [Brevundimonas alba]|uniref:aminotransferase class V-fold PLP-dependent enzyme n=1 Tax=Brevundimonas alba TaxID=74314 RepID=UPI00143B5E2A
MIVTSPTLEGFAQVRIEDAIYLDYQAATPVDPRVAEAMRETMLTDFANPSSDDHALGWKAHQRVELARAAIADAFGAAWGGLIFTSGATEGNNIAILGGARNAPPERRRVLISAIEHKAVLEAASALAAEGYDIERLPVDTSGCLDLDVLEALEGTTVAVISVMAVNNETGVVQPVRAVAQWAKRHGVFFHCDATQAPLAMEVDLSSWGVDAASLSSHKIYGPKGIGVLYLADDRPWTPRPLTFGGGQEQSIRPGTLPTPLCVGFATASMLVSREGAAERERVASLRDSFVASLRDLDPGLRLTAPSGDRHPGNAHVVFSRADAADLLALLQPVVAASLGSACTSGVIGPSHVLTAMGVSDSDASRCVRFSLGRFSDAAQLAEASHAIAKALNKQRGRALPA